MVGREISHGRGAIPVAVEVKNDESGNIRVRGVGSVGIPLATSHILQLDPSIFS